MRAKEIVQQFSSAPPCGELLISHFSHYDIVSHECVILNTHIPYVFLSVFFRSLPKLTAHEDEGVHQNPQYTGQHHFHPVVHDHDFCERVVINVRFFFLLNISNFKPRISRDAS